MTNDRVMSPREERIQKGKDVRANTPRLSLADVADRPTRDDPISALIDEGRGRVQSLLPIRYQRMKQNPLAFFRGAALLMAQDLARGSSTTLYVQLCGDAHLSNFGIFSSPERRLVFDVNDFDETETGPFEWDVKRLVASLAVASEQLGHSASRQEEIALRAAEKYRTAMIEFSSMSRLGVWYSQLDLTLAMKELRGFFSDGARRKIEDIFQRVESTHSEESYSAAIEYVRGAPRFLNDPPHFTPLNSYSDSTLRVKDVDEIVERYVTTLSSDRVALLGQFQIRDVARHVVGVGSVGTECLAVLLTGRDDRDPLLLQIKEARSSVVGTARGVRSHYQPGERVVRGQKLMQATPDVLLGWHTLGPKAKGRSFYVRQLYDNKASVNVEQLNETLLVAYGKVCAWTLARAHARSGTSAEIAGYLGKGRRFDESMASFALQYRARNSADYDKLLAALHEGRLSAS